MRGDIKMKNLTDKKIKQVAKEFAKKTSKKSDYCKKHNEPKIVFIVSIGGGQMCFGCRECFLDKVNSGEIKND